ncbi:hypothetical protein ACFY00_05405 [Kitasatospora sp. NPDC001540]|uniref:hypothetical protein n=1 Tax=Kitasatospora sp. NPDC001540 TaxID=3364014 RepID=UPI0036AB26E3
MSTESADAAEPGTAAAAEPSTPPPTASPTATAPTPANPFAPPSALPETPVTPETPVVPETPVAPDAPDTPDAPGAFGEAEVIEAGAEPVRRKPRFGVGTLFLTAVLAGPLVGAGVGYAIQASRPPTPLPKIAAPKLSYPAERVDPKALAAAGPQPLDIDGDLRKLLIERPAGTEDRTDGDGDGWLSPDDMAENYGDSAREFSSLLSGGFRRAASVAWESGDDLYQVTLAQYVPESTRRAIADAAPSSTHESEVSLIPGNTESYLVIGKQPLHYARSTDTYYYGEALARKGNVVMTVAVYAKNPVDRAQLEDIAKRQWEKLA